MAAGGIATLEGIRYELQVVLYHAPDLLKGDIVSLRYQLPPSASMNGDLAPTRTFLDDFALQDPHGHEKFYQAKKKTAGSTWTIKALAREGVLRQMYNQHVSTPSATVCFVSNIESTKLVQLIKAAKASANVAEFLDNLPKHLNAELKEIRNHLKVEKATELKILSMMQHAESARRTEEDVLSRVKDFAADRYGDPIKFIHVIKDYFERNPGRLITKELLTEELVKHGLFRLPLALPEDVCSIFHRASSDLRNHASTIAGVHIPRAETEVLINWIDSLGSGKGVAALLDAAGSGKSVIMHDLLETLEARGIPALAIKADRLTYVPAREHVASAKTVLRLPDEPESLLAAAARAHARTVLIIDQLDALSMTFARDQGLLDLMLSVISRSSSINGVAVVFSCRAFDRQYDPKIRYLDAVHETKIKPLAKEQIELVLKKVGVDWNTLSVRERDLLQQPQHLELFARVTEEHRKRGISRPHVASTHELYDLLWDLMIAAPTTDTVTTEDVAKAIYVMTDMIEQSQTLSQPTTLFAPYRNVRFYLESVGILHRTGAVVSFFHQSFFDYVFSRRFSAKERSLIKYIRRSDQGLFQRPILVNVLTYLRSSTPDKCVAQVAELVKESGTDRIRYHLRHLTFDWFGQQSHLTEQEKALGLRLVRQLNTRPHFLRGCRGNSEWFDSVVPTLVSLLNSDDKTIDSIIRFLESVQDVRPVEVYHILRSRLGTTEAWNNRIRWCLRYHRHWQSEEAGYCLLWFFENDVEPWKGLDFVLVSVAETNPTLGVRVLKVLLGRFSTSWSATDKLSGSGASEHVLERFPRELHGFVELCKACSEHTPSEYLAAVVPWIESHVAQSKNWLASGQLIESAIFRTGFDEVENVPERDAAKALLKGVRKSLSHLAQSRDGSFLYWADEIQSYRTSVLHQLLIESIISTPQEYADWAFRYLLADRSRLTIGSFGDSSRYSGSLIGAIFPHLNPTHRQQLEHLILTYSPEWETPGEDDADVTGIARLGLFWDIPSALLSRHARYTFRRLRQRFKHYRPRGKPDYTFREVSAPISKEDASAIPLDKWLSHMRHFDDDTDWYGKRKIGSGGGIVELSRQFEQEVIRNPDRFLPIAELLDNHVSSQYWAAFITGLAKSGLSTPKLYDISLALTSRRPHDAVVEMAFCEAVEKRQNDPIPATVLNTVRAIALTSSDPTPEREGSRSYGPLTDDPQHLGYNSARGRCVRLYVVLASRAGEKESSKLLDSISAFARDTSSGVRACLIEVLPLLMRAHSDAVQDAFDIAIRGRPELLESRATHEFIYWSLPKYITRVSPLLRSMIASSSETTRTATGRLITLAWFDKATLKAQYEKCVRGDSALRKGVATVLSRNVDNAQLQPKCLGELQRLFDDRDPKVGHSIANVFDHLPPPTPTIKDFTRKYIRSHAASTSSNPVARYATRIQISDAVFALEIGERLFKRFGESVADHSQHTGMLDDDLVNISMFVYRTQTRTAIKKRALDLFERALQIGSYFAKKALEEVDR